MCSKNFKDHVSEEVQSIWRKNLAIEIEEKVIENYRSPVV